MPLSVVGAYLALALVGDDRAAVIAESLDVFDRPAATAFSTGRLREGDVVVVLGEEPGGWLAIAPPEGQFEWIDAAALGEVSDGVALVRAERAVLRAGRAGARMPGPPGLAVNAGTALRLADREPLVLRQGAARRTWRAVVPPEEVVRYVRASGVGHHSPEKAPPGEVPKRVGARLDSSLPVIGPAIRLPDAGGREALDRIEDDHRRVLEGPIDDWQLAPVRQRYEALRDRATGEEARAALEDRLRRVERQQSAAEAARRFRRELDRARRMDVPRAAGEAGAAAAAEEDLPYDATGLLQPSSKLVEGQRVFALIGPAGHTVAYLRPVPGVAAGSLVGRRVGVRGEVRYDEALRAEVIRVRVLEPLAGRP